jgi:hypothetical protein
MNCLEFRRVVGAEPGSDGTALAAHRATCPACARYQREMRDMDRLLGRAMRVDPSAGRRTAAATAPVQARSARSALGRGWAMAASLVAGVLVAAALWVSWPEPSLAAEVLDHAAHEPQSWAMKDVVSRADVADVLDSSGATLRPDAGDVTFARRCFFDRHWVPHLVVQTDAGPVTVFLLGHRDVAGETHLEGDGYEAIVLPAPRGSIAVVGRDVPGLDAVARQVFESVDWRA